MTKKINAACIVRDLKFLTDADRCSYLDKQTMDAKRKGQPAPWGLCYQTNDPAFSFGLLCGTTYNLNPMWFPNTKKE